MQNYRISIRFSRLPDADLISFSGAVILGMTDNPAFPDPLVPLDELTLLTNQFTDAVIASTDGGRSTTVVKNQRRIILLNALRRQASYVQGISQHNLPQLLTSGFNVASQNSAQSQLPTPAIIFIKNESEGKLTLRVTPIANARNYQVEKRVGNGEWEEVGISSQARRIAVEKLTPGVVYTFQIRALGGSTGYSDWSDATSRMSM